MRGCASFRGHRTRRAVRNDFSKHLQLVRNDLRDGEKAILVRFVLHHEKFCGAVFLAGRLNMIAVTGEARP